jgi:hypothetical protein
MTRVLKFLEAIYANFCSAKPSSCQYPMIKKTVPNNTDPVPVLITSDPNHWHLDLCACIANPRAIVF